MIVLLYDDKYPSGMNTKTYIENKTRKNESDFFRKDHYPTTTII